MILGKLLSHKKYSCNDCTEKFHEYSDLVAHVKSRHHGPLLRCHTCGKEFVRETERYHHIQEEKAKKLDSRRHR